MGTINSKDTVGLPFNEAVTQEVEGAVFSAPTPAGLFANEDLISLEHDTYLHKYVFQRKYVGELYAA